MKWFVLLVGVVVVCFLVALVLGLAGGGMGRPTSSLAHEPLPDEPLSDDDFDDLVFDVSPRGYRMSQVDGVVDRLRRELRERDEQIAVLRGDARDEADAEHRDDVVPEPEAVRGEAREPRGDREDREAAVRADEPSA